MLVITFCIGFALGVLISRWTKKPPQIDLNYYRQF